MIDSLSQAAISMNGVLHGDDRHFVGVSTDTRSIGRDELFFALQGPNFDGHEYVSKACSVAAAGAVVSSVVADAGAQICVDDTRLALGRFAAAWRESLDVTVVGITGSNGKTTLKELVAACLSRKALTLATKGNLNNDIGMPLMLTRINDAHEYAVIEMGANHADEIAYLAALAKPDVVVITNAGAAHLEGFGSVEGVAHAKGELLQTEHRPHCAVLNADDMYYGYWCSLVADIESLSFGFNDNADIRAEAIETRANGSQFELLLPSGRVSVFLPLPGIHNVRNACAAAAVATAMKIDIADIKTALESIVPVAGRIQALPGSNGCTVFDDTYNANPQSAIAAAEFLAGLEGDSWLVLGDMKELGDDAMDLHREVGASARASGVDRLFVLGDLAAAAADAFGDGAVHYDDIDALIAAVLLANNAVNVLVKGSRSMRMERVVEALRATESVRKEA